MRSRNRRVSLTPWALLKNAAQIQPIDLIYFYGNADVGDVSHAESALRRRSPERAAKNAVDEIRKDDVYPSPLEACAARLDTTFRRAA